MHGAILTAATITVTTATAAAASAATTTTLRGDSKWKQVGLLVRNFQNDPQNVSLR